MATQTRRERFAEPWHVTMLRTGTIALAIGVGIGLYQQRLAAVPLSAIIALWFTLGGHFVEVLVRNRLLQRIGGQVPAQAVIRLLTWFVGGSVLCAGALATRALLTGRGAVPWPWWTGGLVFIGLELVVHLLLYARGQPCFYDGRG